jgi:hypothetical protein
MKCQEQGLQKQNKKNEQHEHLLRKYRERFPDDDEIYLIKKVKSFRTNFRKKLKLACMNSISHGSSPFFLIRGLIIFNSSSDDVAFT